MTWSRQLANPNSIEIAEPQTHPTAFALNLTYWPETQLVVLVIAAIAGT